MLYSEINPGYEGSLLVPLLEDLTAPSVVSIQAFFAFWIIPFAFVQGRKVYLFDFINDAPYTPAFIWNGRCYPAIPFLGFPGKREPVILELSNAMKPS